MMKNFSLILEIILKLKEDKLTVSASLRFATMNPENELIPELEKQNKLILELENRVQSL